MFDLIKAALADREDVTALEYALIAATVTTALIGGYKVMFGNLNTFIAAHFS